VKLLKGKRLKSVASSGTQPLLFLAGCISWDDGPASISTVGERPWERGTCFWVCYSPRSHATVGIEDRSMPFWPGFAHVTCLGCWRNGFKRPVLKHGPRSLTCLRVFGCETRTRNESERLGPLSRRAPTPGPDQVVTVPRQSMYVGTRKMVNYA
jgi:hypothetical protein